MQHIFLPFLLIFSFTVNAQQKVKIYHEQMEDGVGIYADNNEHCPISIKIDFSIANLEIEGVNNNIYIVKALSQKQFLTKLKVLKPNKRVELSYKFISNFGIHNSNLYEKDFAYNLPFQKSSSFLLNQGYNGQFSHKNENSLDFAMPIGTEITAVRGGTVIQVIDNNSKSCAKEECKAYNNYIIVYHSDDTFATYAHIKKDGSLVKVGDKIEQGQKIGLSGDVGYTQGPHLHLIIYKQRLDKIESLKTNFKIEEGNKKDYLIENKVYTRNY